MCQETSGVFSDADGIRFARSRIGIGRLIFGTCLIRLGLGVRSGLRNRDSMRWLPRKPLDFRQIVDSRQPEDLQELPRCAIEHRPTKFLRSACDPDQSSLEEEQNQQLLVRLVLSYFQAQALERQAAANMESLIEEDSTPSKSGATQPNLR